MLVSLCFCRGGSRKQHKEQFLAEVVERRRLLDAFEKFAAQTGADAQKGAQAVQDSLHEGA
jgi:hypothetical protein